MYNIEIAALVKNKQYSNGKIKAIKPHGYFIDIFSGEKIKYNNNSDLIEGLYILTLNETYRLIKVDYISEICYFAKLKIGYKIHEHIFTNTFEIAFRSSNFILMREYASKNEIVDVKLSENCLEFDVGYKTVIIELDEGVMSLVDKSNVLLSDLEKEFPGILLAMDEDVKGVCDVKFNYVKLNNGLHLYSNIEVTKKQFNESGFYVPPYNQKIFDLAIKCMKNNKFASILLRGPSGYGKTSTAEYIAKINDLDFFKVDCSVILENKDWFGYMAAKDGSTHFVKSLLAQKLEEGNCLILFDELNRLEPNLANSLLPILDDTKEITFDNMKLTVGNNILFCATINEGYQYTGTFQSDSALLNRFALSVDFGDIYREAEMGILQDFAAYDICDKILEVAKFIRRIDKTSCPIRTTKQIAMYASDISDLRILYEACVVSKLPDESKKDAIDIINSLLGVVNV